MFRRDVLVKRQDTVTPGLIWLIQVWSSGSHAAMENVQIADDHRGFVLATSGIRFVPWGFNYDRDENGRLLEDYWEHEWPKIVADFREMKGLGANIVRVHLQLGKFMKGLDQPDAHALDRLANLVTLAEQTGLYVDLTGLGCYRKRDVPALVRYPRRAGALGRAGPVLGGDRVTMRQQLRRLLLRLDERARRAGRTAPAGRVAGAAPGRISLRPGHHARSEGAASTSHCTHLGRGACESDPACGRGPSDHGRPG